MRIIHFSDIHARARLETVGHLFDKRLLGFFNYLLRRHLHQDWRRIKWMAEQIAHWEPDVVVCTGDITSLGGPKEFEMARQALAPLRDNPAIDFLYVPGNHDAYVQCRRSNKALNHAFSDLNRGRWELNQLPIIHSHDAMRFLLINQAAPAPLLASYGALDMATRNWLDAHMGEIVGDHLPPLALISHFPLLDAAGNALSWRRACRHNEPLRDALRDGHIRLALCGHIHTPFARQEPDGGLEVCAGSLTHTGIFSVVDYSPENDTLAQQWIELKSPADPVPDG